MLPESRDWWCAAIAAAAQSHRRRPSPHALADAGCRRTWSIPSTPVALTAPTIS